MLAYLFSVRVGEYDHYLQEKIVKDFFFISIFASEVESQFLGVENIKSI